MSNEKPIAPAYVSYKSFNSFFNSRREDGHVTMVVDRTLMDKFSGSTVTEMLSSLKSLKLIGEKGKPSPIYEQYVQADDAQRKVLLEKILREAYPFVLNVTGFDLERATSGQVADKFRAQGISGSTLSRAITFFLAAAKDAGIKVSPNIKPPPAAKPQGGRARAATAAAAVPANGASDEDEGDEDQGTATAVLKFEIPIPGKRSVRIIVPDDFDAEDFDMLDAMLKAYIKRWKGYTSKTDEAK